MCIPGGRLGGTEGWRVQTGLGRGGGRLSLLEEGKQRLADFTLRSPEKKNHSEVRSTVVATITVEHTWGTDTQSLASHAHLQGRHHCPVLIDEETEAPRD